MSIAGTIRDERGSAAVQFAIVAPAFIALLLAILETSLCFFAQETLNSSVEQAARTIVTGQTQAGDITGAGNGMSAADLQERFRKTVCATLPVFLRCANLMVDVQSVTSFSAANTAAPTITYDQNGNVNNSWAYNTGSAGSIVIVRLFYIWSVPTGPLNFNISNLTKGKRLLMSTSVAKTEAYQ